MIELQTLGRVRLVGNAEPASSSTQPKRLALLAYLALAGQRGPIRRDALLALFWPELAEEEGRRALRQALHYLRRVIRDDVFTVSGDELGINDAALRCDAVAFEQLADAGDGSGALALYAGDFMDGFYVDDVASEYEEWVDRTRGRLRRRAAGVAWVAADAAAAANDVERAVELGRRACDLEPDQEAGWRRLMTLQNRIGDRAGALRTYDELAKWLEREFSATPSAETTALVERIRVASEPTGANAPPIAAPNDAASRVERVPALTESPVAPATGVGRPRWRPATIAAVAAAVAAATVGTYVTMSGANAEPSLVTAGAVNARDRVVVADFANLADDTTLAAAVTEAFRIDLSQSPLVRVLTPPQVGEALARMERPAGSTLDDSVAREVAIRVGAKAFVTGSVAKVGAAYTVAVQLLSSERAEPLAAVRETATDSTGLISAIDRASKGLRHRIGESLRDLRDMPPLYDETTASLAALRKYTEAQRLKLAGRRTEAIAAYEDAVRLDTTFASAYVALGMTYGSVAEEGRARAAGAKARQYAHRLPFLERNYLIGSHAYGGRDYETAIAAYNSVLERYPDNYGALNNLALVYQDKRQYAVAESLFARAATVDSTIANFYFGMHGEQVLQGKFRESRATLDLIARRFPENSVLLTVEMQDAAAQQQWEEAARRAETIIAAAQGDTLALIDPFEALAGIMMTEGRLAEAERHWRTQLTLSKAVDSKGRHLFGLIQLAKLELRHRRSSERALRLVDSALAAMPLDSVLPGDRPLDELARFYADAGNLTRARQMLAAAEANDRVLDRSPGPDRAWTRGVIALAERRTSEAEDQLRQASEGLVCAICALPDLARAYETTGKPQTAVVVYERYLTTPWLWRYEPDAPELGWALKRLAELYDAQGDATKAAGTRRRLLQLWRRADPELQPVVAEVRGRIDPVR